MGRLKTAGSFKAINKKMATDPRQGLGLVSDPTGAPGSGRAAPWFPSTDKAAQG